MEPVPNRAPSYSVIRGVKHTFTPIEQVGPLGKDYKGNEIPTDTGEWVISHPYDPSTFKFAGVTDLAEAKKHARRFVLAPDMRKPRKKKGQ